MMKDQSLISLTESRIHMKGDIFDIVVMVIIYVETNHTIFYFF